MLLAPTWARLMSDLIEPSLGLRNRARHPNIPSIMGCTRQCCSITHCILCSPLKRQSSTVSELPCRNRVRLNDYLRSSISNLQPTLTAEAQRVRLTAHSVSSAICYDTRL
ncbi:hypothetical protein KC19_2G251300 [Ceratodon purpureus]|uniref:Uncharacterized protein n=1 Tax=Ceratodon purpureus TaxID=3225 RepID=A0A8T0J0X3_CERPU|nr:hypothetical protein KC19_2G251300 [Ceratodon purpureus]